MALNKVKIAFLCGSGGGDLVAIDNAIRLGVIKNVEISAVLVPKNNSLLKEQFSETLPVIEYSIDKENKDQGFRNLLSLLDNVDLSYIFLSGFKFILPSYFLINSCPIINSHHSLLPAHPGLFRKEEVVQTDVGIIGHTLHYVDTGVDTGKKIMQVAMPNLGMERFEDVLFNYRLAADIMNLHTLMQFTTNEKSLDGPEGSYTHKVLLFSERIHPKVIDYIESSAYKNIR